MLRCASGTLREIPGWILAFEDCVLLGVRQHDAGVRREATCMLHSQANTRVGVLEPLKDSRLSQNAKIRPMEFPQRNSQHGEVSARKHRTSTEHCLKNIMHNPRCYHGMSCMQHLS